MRQFISIVYLAFILFMGMAQGGFFIDKMECRGSGSVALMLNARMSCCEMDSDSGNHEGLRNPCCLHDSFFVENDVETEHQISKIEVPAGAEFSSPVVEFTASQNSEVTSSLEIRPPPDLTQAKLCVFRI